MGIDTIDPPIKSADTPATGHVPPITASSTKGETLLSRCIEVSLPTSRQPGLIKSKFVQFVKDRPSYRFDGEARTYTQQKLDSRQFKPGNDLIHAIQKMRDTHYINSVTADYASAEPAHSTWDPNTRQLVYRRTRQTITILTPYPKSLESISPMYIAGILAAVLEKELYVERSTETGQTVILLPYPVFQDDGQLDPRYTRILRLTQEQFADVNRLIGVQTRSQASSPELEPNR